jgi:flagellar motor switch protein FliM
MTQVDPSTVETGTAPAEALPVVVDGEVDGSAPSTPPSSAASAPGATSPEHDVPADKAAAPGRVAATAVRVHDFRLPKTLDRNRIRGLQVLFEALAHRASGLLTNRLRTPVTLTPGEFEQHTWGDYASTLPEPTCLFAATMAPLQGRVVLHVPLSLAMTVVELRMGGTGRGTYDVERALTEIEQRLLADVADAVLSELPSVLAQVMTLQIGTPMQVASAQFLPPVRPTDMGLLIPLDFELHEDARYSFELLFPFSIVQPLVDTIAAQNKEEEMPGVGDADAVARRLLETPVDVRILFPPTTLTPADFLHLAVGDVVGLPYDQGEALALVVGDQHHLDVLPTTNGKRLACVVVDHTE